MTALDLVEPGRAGRRAVEDDPGIGNQPAVVRGGPAPHIPASAHPLLFAELPAHQHFRPPPISTKSGKIKPPGFCRADDVQYRVADTVIWVVTVVHGMRLPVALRGHLLDRLREREITAAVNRARMMPC